MNARLPLKLRNLEEARWFWKARHFKLGSHSRLTSFLWTYFGPASLTTFTTTDEVFEEKGHLFQDSSSVSHPQAYWQPKQ